MNLPASTVWRWLNDYDRRPRTAARTVRATTSRSRLDRRFGIEVEFVGDIATVAAAMRDAGFNCGTAGYSETSPNRWLVKRDGSVRNGGELVSPPLRGAEGFEQVRRALAVVVATGATVDTSTGLHVHHDAEGIDLAAMKRIVRSYGTADAAPTWRELEALVRRAQWRHHGRWAFRVALRNRARIWSATRISVLGSSEHLFRELERAGMLRIDDEDER